MPRIQNEGLIPQISPETLEHHPDAAHQIYAVSHPNDLGRYVDYLTDKGGRLAILRIPSHHFVLHDVDGYSGEALRGAEPGDWYANKPIPPEDIEDTGLRLDPGQEPDFPSKLALHKTADKPAPALDF